MIHFYAVMISQSSQTPFWNHRRDILGPQQEEFISGFIREERRKKQKIEHQAKADANRAWKDKVKHITPVLVAVEKNKDDKASSFPQIRDFLKKKCKLSRTEFATWTAENIVEKWNNFHS